MQEFRNRMNWAYVGRHRAYVNSPYFLLGVPRNPNRHPKIMGLMCKSQIKLWKIKIILSLWKFVRKVLSFALTGRSWWNERIGLSQERENRHHGCWWMFSTFTKVITSLPFFFITSQYAQILHRHAIHTELIERYVNHASVKTKTQ